MSKSKNPISRWHFDPADYDVCSSCGKHPVTAAQPMCKGCRNKADESKKPVEKPTAEPVQKMSMDKKEATAMDDMLKIPATLAKNAATGFWGRKHYTAPVGEGIDAKHPRWTLWSKKPDWKKWGDLYRDFKVEAARGQLADRHAKELKGEDTPALRERHAKEVAGLEQDIPIIRQKAYLMPGNVLIPTGRVNNCTAVDLDMYEWDDDMRNDWEARFGKDWIKTFNTYTQLTSSGKGYHLVFKYNKEFGSPHGPGIDIRNDGGLIMGAGSLAYLKTSIKEAGGKDKFHQLPWSERKKHLGEYTCVHNAPLAEMPEALVTFLHAHVKSGSGSKKKSTKKPDRSNPKDSAITAAASGQEGFWKYHIDDEKVERMVRALPPKYFAERVPWLTLATAMKQMGKVDLLLRIVESMLPQLDPTWSIEWYEAVIPTITRFNEFCMPEQVFAEAPREADGADGSSCHDLDIAYSKYQNSATCGAEQCYQSVHRGEWRKLGLDHGEHAAVKLTPDKRCVVIKSDTGTGKSTLFREYMNEQVLDTMHMPTPLTYLSIVSRISLAEEQHRTFKEAGLRPILYCDTRHPAGFVNSCLQSEWHYIVICIDSLERCRQTQSRPYNVRWCGNTIIFLDEFSSLIEHLFTSSTLSTRRVQVFKTLCEMLRSAKQIICADADITPHTVAFLEWLKIPIHYIENSYVHNSGTPAQEYFEKTAWTDALKQRKEFVCCSDSAKGALELQDTHFNTIPLTEEEKEEYKGLSVTRDEHGLVIALTGQDTRSVDMDAWDRLIVSPRVVYGLDSTRRREVFCSYECPAGMTLTPKHMLQQICRTRDMIKLHFVFYRKKCAAAKYSSRDEIYREIRMRSDFATWAPLCTAEEEEIWCKITSYIEWHEECYRTNPFAWFLKLLDERGFVRDKSIVQETELKELAQQRRAFKAGELERFDPSHPKNVEIIEYLGLPEDAVQKHAALVLFEGMRVQHFHVCKWVLRGAAQLDKVMGERKEFNAQKMRSENMKQILLEGFMKEVGCTSRGDLVAKTALSAEAADTFKKKVQIVCPRLATDLDLTTIDGCSLAVVKMMAQLFGRHAVEPYAATEKQKATGNTQRTFTKTPLFITKRKQVNKKKVTVYSINEAFFKHHMRIARYKTPTVALRPDMGWDAMSANLDPQAKSLDEYGFIGV